MGCYEYKHEGVPIVLKSDNSDIFLACGIRLARLSMPELTQTYVIETDHSDLIVDFTLTAQAIITT